MLTQIPSHTQTQTVTQIAQRLQVFRYRLVTAESCTGGMIGARLTDLPGASKWYEGGFITYSNQAKQRLLGVSETLLQGEGAVSEAVACAMVMGALARTGAQIGLAITGIAGPPHHDTIKPVGLVWLAWAKQIATDVPPERMTRVYYFSGNRQQIRAQATEQAFMGLLDII